MASNSQKKEVKYGCLNYWFYIGQMVSALSMVCVNAMSPFYGLNPSPLFAVAIGHQFHGNRCPSSNPTFSSNLMSISVTRSSNNLIMGAFHTSDICQV